MKTTTAIFALLLLVALGSAAASTSGTKLRHTLVPDPAILGAGPIYAKAWMQYFYTYDGQPNPPSTFLINEAFKVQTERQDYIDRMAADGSDASGIKVTNIPDNHHFYFYLDKDSIYVTSSHAQSVKDTYDSLTLSELDDVPTGANYAGGIVDLGNFKEGFCFRLTGTHADSGIKFYWNVCADKMADKDAFMTKIKYLKEKKKADPAFKDGPFAGGSMASATLTDEEEEQEEEGIAGGFGGGDILSTDSEGKRDGKWVLLQDWTQCSLACGGGTQTLQRVCIPPTGGGAACSGEAVMNRECNTQECATAVAKEIEGPKTVLPTKIEQRVISTELQSYEDCKRMVGDLEIEMKGLPQFQVPPKLPTMTILNNATLTVFKGDKYDSVEYSIELKDIRAVQPADHDERCFVVQGPDADRTQTLCIMAAETYPVAQYKKEWMDAIMHFKNDCQKKPRHLQPQTDYDFRKKMSQLEEDVMQAKSDSEDDKFAVQEETKIDQNVQDTAGVALQAMQREISLENMAEEAEESKERQDNENLQKQLDDSKNKQGCVQKALARKAKKEALKKKKASAEKKISDIKDQIKQQITVQRGKEQKKLELMKKENERKKEKTMKQIEDVRSAMVKQATQAEKAGNATLCLVTDQTKIDTYCDDNYMESFTDNKDCKSPSEFCIMCCESEFGDSYPNERADCKNQCTEQPEPPSEEDGGKWVWVPQENDLSR